LLAVFFPAFTLLPSVLQELKTLSPFVGTLRLGKYRFLLCATCDEYILAGTGARSTFLALRCAGI
jgi:hypothetical protein